MAPKIKVDIVGDASGLSRAFAQAGGSAGRFGSLMAKAGKAAAIAGTAIATGLAAGLASSAKAAIDFERQMRNVNSIAKLGEKDFKALGKSVTGMAAEVGQKPKVLASGLYDIVSSGFKAADAVKILRVSAKAATAGMTDTATASKAVTAALNAYHQGAGKAREVSDVLFQTVNKGVLTFEELSQQMGDLVPASAPLGVSLEEVGASMATLTLQGVPAAEAATRVKSAMIQLAKPSKGLSALLKENGFASGEAAIKAKGFSGVLQLLSDATHGSVSETAKLTPEIRSLLGVVGLTGKNLKTYEANLRAMKTAQQGAGITSKVFAEQSKSVAVQWQKAAAALDVFKIQVGTALLPAIASGLGALSGFLKKLNEAQGFKAKIDVVLDVGQGLYESLKRAILGGVVNVGDDVDVRMGFQNGLQQNLQKAIQGINWTAAGQSMLEGFRKAFQASAAATDEVMGKISEAIIRNKGKIAEAGAVIAVSIFTTLLDPAFWARHWDLALSVAAVVFRAKILTFGGKLIGFFNNALVGLGEKFGGRLGGVLVGAVVTAERLVLAALGALGKRMEAVVTGAFGRLGKLAFFIVRVLGIETAIAAVAHFATAVYNKLKDLVGKAGSAAADVGHAIVHGIVRGIYEIGPGLIKAAAEWLASLIPGWMKKLLHIDSPSLVMRDQVGKPIVEGVAAGMRAGVPMIASATSVIIAEVNKLQRQLDAINARRESEDRAAAVRDATAALSEARSKGEGVAAAEQALARAREDITIAAVTKRLGIETAHFDKLKALIDSQKEKLADAFGNLAEFAGRAFDAKTQKMLDRVAAKFDRLIAMAQAAGDKLTPAEAALRALDRAEQERSRNQALSDAQAGGDPDAIRQAQLAIQRAALEDQAAVERAARDRQTAVQVAALEATKARELQNLNERRDQLAAKLDEQLAVLQTKMALHPKEYAKNQQAIVKLLNSFGVNYKSAGQNLGEAFANGLDAAQDAVRKSARNLAKVMDDNLHARSPTKEGPMSTLDTWFKKVGSTLASGLDTGAITKALGSIAMPTLAPTLAPGLAPAAVGVGGVGVGVGGGTTIQLMLDRRVISEVFRQDLIQIGRRNGSALGGLA